MHWHFAPVRTLYLASDHHCDYSNPKPEGRNRGQATTIRHRLDDFGCSMVTMIQKQRPVVSVGEHGPHNRRLHVRPRVGRAAGGLPRRWADRLSA